MKQLLFFSILLFVFSSLFSQKVEQVYSFDLPEITKSGDYSILKLENTLNTGKLGEPSLPYYAVKILLPPGQKAVSIEFERQDEVLLNTEFQILPQQQSRPVSLEEDFQFNKSYEVYDKDEFYPIKQTGELTTAYLNGYAIALSSFTPVSYNPVSGEIKICRKVKLTVITEDCDESFRALSNMSNKNTIVQYVNNPDLISSYPVTKSRSDDYEMLIITPTSYIDDFEALTDFYLLRGIKTTITSVEDIDAGMYGDDLQEKIRNYIIDEYQNRNIRFVLLGGDVQFVPSRGFYAYVSSGEGYEDNNIPADLYYAALDGNWNNDGDHSYGEPGEEDFLPEIAVGRFSFSNAEELENMIHKTISYQSNPVLGEFNNALFAGELLWDDPLTYGSDYLEMLVGNQTANGYETTGIPESYNIQRLYDEVEYWDAYSLMNAVNSGKQYVHHVGHADYNYVSFMYNEDITNENFSEANGVDHNYTIFHSHGCVCGAFDYDDCILERMVCIDNFAVAVIGNSRYGWFNEGQNEGPAAHLHREMMDAIYDDGIYCIGEAFADCKIQTAPWITAPGQWEEGALRWNFYDLNLLGDPSLAIWTQEPVNLTVNYENTMQLNATQTSVNVSISSVPTPDLNCVILKNGIIHGTGITDELGNAVIDIDIPFAEIGNAMLVVSGNNCKPISYPIAIENVSGIITANKTEINIYPNPASNFVIIEFENEPNENSYFSIYSQTGQLVATIDIKNRINKIDIDKLALGNYFLKVVNGDKESSVVLTKE
jgi:hypothetical protein